MDEHADLDATVATPRVELPPRNVTPAVDAPAQVPESITGIPPPIASTPLAAPVRAPYVFGNPFAYVLRRFLAVALDLALITGVATMLLYGLIAINPFTGLPNTSAGGFDATFALGLGIALTSMWILEAVFGTTLGKLAFSLHVYAPSHRFVGFGRAFVRTILRPIDVLVIGLVLALLPGHRRLGDLFSGTLVARSPLRAFSPLVGWIAIIALAALPFFVAGGTVTVLAVAAAFIEFIPPLIAHAFSALLQLVGSGTPHVAT